MVLAESSFPPDQNSSKCCFYQVSLLPMAMWGWLNHGALSLLHRIALETSGRECEDSTSCEYGIGVCL